jgi:hypothetical protein
MARRPTRADVLAEIEKQFGREIAASFEAVAADLVSGARMADIIRELERGNLEAALRAFNLDAAALRPLESSIVGAYQAAGTRIAKMIDDQARRAGASAVLRFDMVNPRASRWLADISSRMVTEIIQDQRAAVRVALRQGMDAGRGPRQVALEIVGRIDRATKRRAGGILGLHSQQAGYVRSMRAELAGGEPGISNYFTRALRDRRFDDSILSAIDAGRPVAQRTIDGAATSYSNRLLKHRGDTIARTETIGALNTAKDDAYRQSVDSGMVEAEALTKEWDATGNDGRTRQTHLDLDGQVVALDAPFVSSSGAMLMHPHDASLGAPAAEIIACRCIVKYKIDHFRGLK